MTADVSNEILTFAQSSQRSSYQSSTRIYTYVPYFLILYVNFSNALSATHHNIMSYTASIMQIKMELKSVTKPSVTVTLCCFADAQLSWQHASFVTMATGVSWGLIWMIPLQCPTTKTPIWYIYTSRVITDLVFNVHIPKFLLKENFTDSRSPLLPVPSPNKFGTHSEWTKVLYAIVLKL